MIVVHHLNNSRSHRVLWLLEELAVPYEVEHYLRDPKTLRAPAALRKVHPLGRAPVVTDGDRTMAESGAVLEYLLEKHGGGRLAPPPGSPERLRYMYWMHYAEGSAMLPLVLRLLFDRLPRQPMPMLARPVVRTLTAKVIEGYIQPQIDEHLSFMEAELAKSVWFAGDEFTAADIQMSFPIEGTAARGDVGAARPRLSAYLQRIRERTAYKRAVERGGPFQLGGLGT